jgi:rhodanese-related sulfurtransferase
MSTATIDDLLAGTRAGLDRVSPQEARAAQLDGALLVDIRPEAYRVLEGTIPGALEIERNVLEWRLDPSCPTRIREASYDARIIVFCNEGYASSFAAASLQRIGVSRATDLIGGYRAWRAASLPVDFD